MHTQLVNTINSLPGNGKKVLFASMPMDGHFNPLTSLAVHLQRQGYEVRWYTGNIFQQKLQKLGIPHYPFIQAKEVTQHNMETLFPERKNIKGFKRLSFDMCNSFILRGPEFLADIKNIFSEFPFDVMIADICFTGIPFIRDVLQKPVISIGVIPLVEKSKDIAPPGVGLPPATTWLGKKGYQLLNSFVDSVLLKQPNQLMLRLLAQYGIATKQKSVFEILIEKSSAVLQVGCPGFEYRRRHISKHIRFIGPLLPLSPKASSSFPFQHKLSQFSKVLLLTQGTLEPDHDKLIIPTLEAFKNTNILVLVATAGNHTKALRKKYAFDNIVVEDYIDFNHILPHVDVYVSNGGYGGVLLSIMNKVPMVVGGKYEGKNEICARVGYFKIGINLQTETPTKVQVKKAVDAVLADPAYKANISKLAVEMANYKPLQICEQVVLKLTKNPIHVKKEIEEESAIC